MGVNLSIYGVIMLRFKKREVMIKVVLFDCRVGEFDSDD